MEQCFLIKLHHFLIFFIINFLIIFELFITIFSFAWSPNRLTKFTLFKFLLSTGTCARVNSNGILKYCRFYTIKGTFLSVISVSFFYTKNFAELQIQHFLTLNFNCFLTKVYLRFHCAIFFVRKTSFYLKTYHRKDTTKEKYIHISSLR